MDPVERIDTWGRLAPDRTAYQRREKILTYGALSLRSDTLAAFLARVLPRDRSAVGLVGRGEADHLVACLGVLKAGHPYIPIDSAIPSRQVDQRLEAGRAVLTLTPGQVAALAAGPQPVGVPAPGWRPVRSDPWCILFPDGWTGGLDRQVITAGDLESLVEAHLVERSGAGTGEPAAEPAPLPFDPGGIDWYFVLAAGGRLS